MAGRTKRLVGRVTGYGKKIVNYEEIRDGGLLIGQLWRRLLPVAKSAPRREETFANAYQRLGLDEQQLELAHRLQVWRFYIFSAGFAIGMGIGLRAVLTAHWFAGFMSIGFLSLCGAMLFQASFRAFQIEQRELVDVRYWFQHPGRWVPGWGKASHTPAADLSIKKIEHTAAKRVLRDDGRSGRGGKNRDGNKPGAPR